MNITECERRVLTLIYELKEDACIKAICEGVNRRYNTDWSEKAIAQFIKRLLQKKYITRKKQDKKIYYKPVFNREKIDIAALWDIRDSSFERDWEKVIAYIREQQNATEIKDIKKLKELKCLEDL